MSGKRSRNKGKRGELELAKLLSAVFPVECRRGQQYNGLEGDDVVGLPGAHIECKRTERLQLGAALSQSIKDAGTKVPVVMHRGNRQPWLVTLRVEDLPALIHFLSEVI